MGADDEAGIRRSSRRIRSGKRIRRPFYSGGNFQSNETDAKKGNGIANVNCYRHHVRRRADFDRDRRRQLQ